MTLTNKAKTPTGSDHALRRRIALSRWIAKIVLFAEALAPVLLVPLSVAALYIAFAWFGLFRLMPYILVKPVAILFALVFIWSLKGLLTLRWPDDAKATRRLEEKSGLAHQALSTLDDTLSKSGPSGSGAFAEALWREHKRRMTRMIGPLAAGTPSPGISTYDRYGLRAIPLLALFVAFGYSVSNHAGKLSDPFSLKSLSEAEASLRVDVWVTPPVYTHKPPIFLTGTGQEAANTPLLVPDWLRAHRSAFRRNRRCAGDLYAGCRRKARQAHR